MPSYTRFANRPELEAIERDQIAARGRSLLAHEVYEHLEAIRVRSGARLGYLVRRG